MSSDGRDSDTATDAILATDDNTTTAAVAPSSSSTSSSTSSSSSSSSSSASPSSSSSSSSSPSSSSSSSWSFIAASSMKCRWCQSPGQVFITHNFPQIFYFEPVDHVDGQPLPLCREHFNQYHIMLNTDAKEYVPQLPPLTSTEQRQIDSSASAWKKFVRDDPVGRAFDAEPPLIVRNYNPDIDPFESSDEDEPEIPPWCMACRRANMGWDGRDVKHYHTIFFLRNRIAHPMLVPEEHRAEVEASIEPVSDRVWCDAHIGDLLRLIRNYDPIKLNIQSRLWRPMTRSS